MRFLFKHFFSLSILLLTALSQSNFAQCSLTDNSRDSLFITYERTAQVKVDGEDKLQSGVILRLHNNSTCAVIITTGSADKFYKPLPANPTVLQRIKREIEYDLPDGVLVSEVQYRYPTLKGFNWNIGGDFFFGFNLLGNRSLLFEVPLKHFDSRFGGLEIEFEYAWEKENRAKDNYGSVEHFVIFSSGELPDEVWKEINKAKK